MKTKLVLWGANAQEERVLIALELLAEVNKVKLYTFPENIATEEFSQQLMNEWRDGKTVEFPEGYTIEERELSVTDGLLPESLKVERGDVIQRAQTEWHFVVLSSKLNEAYQSELNDLQDRIEQLEKYDSSMWESLKTFWNKVQTQVREKNLFRDHANTLRDNTNALFTKLKDLRSKMDQEFEVRSKENLDKFMEILGDVERRVSEGLRLQPIFDELKGIQRNFRDSKLTRDHRSKVWERLDAAFKEVKEKRFGNRDEGSSPMDRLKRRYDGLLAAIEKMENSIKRDENDLEFQNRKIASTDGQLEAQIRKAKIKMIEERIRSKKEKLGEMQSTKTELEGRVEKQKVKDADRAKREELEKAKKEAEEKIKQQVMESAAKREEAADKLEKAAEAIKGTSTKKEEEPKEESLLSAIGTTVGEALEDVVDTVKAVAEVVEDKIEDAIDDLKDKVLGEEDEDDEKEQKEDTPKNESAEDVPSDKEEQKED
ncbi:MAG: hypothetical protein MK226_10360 [Saprospiraceae bacterium]|nr:hypothetical protein [Saprospiraceae bacterium]